MSRRAKRHRFTNTIANKQSKKEEGWPVALLLCRIDWHESKGCLAKGFHGKRGKGTRFDLAPETRNFICIP
jgi:hypothetical protein